MRRPAIRTLLTALFAVSVLLIVAPVAIVVLALQWRDAVDILDHHLKEDLTVAAQLLRTTPEGVEWAYAGAADPGYDAAQQRWVEVFDGGGRLVYTRGAAGQSHFREALPQPQLGGGDRYETITTPAGVRVRLFTSVRQMGDRPFVIRVARSKQEIRSNWSRLAWTFLISILFAAALAAVAGHLIAGRALAPIARLTERARRISAERLDERLPVENPHDELGELAQVFNATFQRLQTSFERLKRFTADASHELRTPLTAIRSVGEVGLRSARTPEEYREIIGSMLEESDRLTRLVGSLLTVSRWEAGEAPVTRSILDLSSVAAGVANELGVLAEEKGIDLRCRHDGPLPVLANQEMLHQAVANLVDNAIKYTPPGGVIDVLTRRAGNFAELHVIDQGPGIPPEDLPRVFDRFYRVDKGRGREVGGVGLGLAIARGAVEANQGRIQAYAAEGGGSRFVITLTCAPPGLPLPPSTDRLPT